jgi:2-(1,2-epoxy-1,2-dihydrophenyl)acetyl-CoA isomerase
LIKGPTHAYAGAKRLMHQGFVESLETQSENEIRTIYEMVSTDDTKETIRSFNERRTPIFKAGEHPRRRYETG